MTDMTPEVAALLRAPFKAEQIGKLPRVTCGNCSRDKQRKHCDRHQRAQCQTCGNYISTAHMHLDYAGHAAITDRLLQADREWTWEPLAIGQDGLPVLDRNAGLWIRLTVAGVTRLGYGDAEGKAGPSAVKEAIGDALRNGAMRFGVGLDLWHKDGTLVQDDEPAPPAQTAPRSAPQNGHETEPGTPSAADRARADLLAACESNGWDRAAVLAEFAKRYDGADLRIEDNAPRIVAFTKLLPDVFAPASNGAVQ